jgi:hypothetical protein
VWGGAAGPSFSTYTSAFLKQCIEKQYAELIPRLSYDKTLTVKGQIIEQHVSAFVRRYGTCGAFGEDFFESLHPLGTRCRLITRTMRKPEARHKATIPHLRIKVIAPSTAAAPKHTRVSKKANYAAAAAAAAAAPGPVLGAGVATLLDIRSPARHLGFARPLKPFFYRCTH